jgi:hypothetical protein
MADQDLPLFTDDQKSALVTLLKDAIAGDHYPLSPRIGTIRGILAKLEGPKPAPVPRPSQRNYAPPRHIAARRSVR